jgi:hypothetical protein
VEFIDENKELLRTYGHEVSDEDQQHHPDVLGNPDTSVPIESTIDTYYVSGRPRNVSLSTTFDDWIAGDAATTESETSPSTTLLSLGTHCSNPLTSATPEFTGPRKAGGNNLTKSPSFPVQQCQIKAGWPSLNEKEAYLLRHFIENLSSWVC